VATAADHDMVNRFPEGERKLVNGTEGNNSTVFFSLVEIGTRKPLYNVVIYCGSGSEFGKVSGSGSGFRPYLTQFFKNKRRYTNPKTGGSEMFL
jgi:hypothetical protein